MPVRGNAYFNNPQFAQAAANLGALFAPPSGADAAGWAAANAKKEEASRLAQLFTMAQDPGANQTTFDRSNIAVGNYNPTQSYYAQDMNNNTAMRGQDITAQTSLANNAADNANALVQRKLMEDAAMQRLGVTDATQRYGYDTQATTSRLNNAADVGATMRGQDITAQTAIANNTANNQREILTNRVDNNTKMLGNIYQPLNQGQIAPAIDPTVAAAFGFEGLPAIPERQGAAKPLTESEFNAAILGQLPPEEQRAAALGATPVENVVTPEGPRTVFRADAVGQQPYFNKGAEAKPQNAVALMPDGRTRVPAIQGPDGKWVHAQTGQPLPSDIQIFDLPKATGSASDIGLSPTAANITQGNNQEAEVTRALDVLDLYEASVRNNPGAIGLAGLIRGTAQNAAQTAQDLAGSFGKAAPEIQQYAQEAQTELRKIAPEFFDPSIPEQEFLQSTLAYALARTENPAGEVGRFALDRALERVKGGGLLANQQSALAAIAANRKVLQTQIEAIRTLRAPGTGRTDTAFQPPSIAPAGPAAPAAVERWIKGPDGRPMRAN